MAEAMDEFSPSIAERGRGRRKRTGSPSDDSALPSRMPRSQDRRQNSSYSPPAYRDRCRSAPPSGSKHCRREHGGYERGRGRSRNDDHRRARSRWQRRKRRKIFRSPSLSPIRLCLMTYKQFVQELEDDVLPTEAEKRYEEYRTEYISTKKRAYFDAHKDEKWLKDKYHPTNLFYVIKKRNINAREAAKQLWHDKQCGTLDLGPGLTSSTSNKSTNSNTEDQALYVAPKAHPVSAEHGRIQIDLKQIHSLVDKLDDEKDIEDTFITWADCELEGVKLLDTLITYLWRVHGVDYYGMYETNEPKGLRHVRADREEEALDGSKTLDFGDEWEKKIDSFWQQRIITKTGKEKIEEEAVKALDPYVLKKGDERFGCGVEGCTKLFFEAEFVHKHIKLMHPEVVTELTTKVWEDLYFQNYMNDPTAPGGTTIMQQPALKTPRRSLFAVQNSGGSQNSRSASRRGDRRSRSYQDLDAFEDEEKININYYRTV